ncbi:MAG: chemotaxis protein CheX [Thermodesulfobacteriota bacterium]|nr:chemotaxis protein CheX [Thermodesulfobacteriota bacterium]
MDEFAKLDFKPLIANAIGEVFQKMLSLEAGVMAGGPQEGDIEDRIVGSVGFAGKVMGKVNIHLSDAFARVIAASMLGIELEEIEGQEEVDDVVSELSNMIGGQLKTHIAGTGLSCELSLPSITRGSNFEIEAKGWARHEKIGFSHQQHRALAELYIKSSE